MKTRESIAAYNKEYFARPDVIARAKVRNALRRAKRADYKKTENGKLAEKRYRQSTNTKQRLYRNRLKTRYNITPDELEAMKLSQQYLCAICHTSPQYWHIDHCHETNQVRGLLCGSCNMALGLFKDNPAFLNNAIKYLS